MRDGYHQTRLTFILKSWSRVFYLQDLVPAAVYLIKGHDELTCIVVLLLYRCHLYDLVLTSSLSF